MERHVSSQIRRAKRSKAKVFDLSCLGLPRWPQEIFELAEVETLKLNDNELAEIPPELSRLESLINLDLSNNKIDKLPELDFSKLQHLGSIDLAGNPVAEKLPAATLQQLALPKKLPGKSPAEALRNVLVGALKESVPASTEAARGPVAAAAAGSGGEVRGAQKLEDYMKDLSGSDADYSDDFHEDEDGPAASRPAPAAVASRAAAGRRGPVAGSTRVESLAGGLDSDSDEPRPTRQVAGSRTAEGNRKPAPAGGGKGQIVPDAKVEQLQAEVEELKAQLASSRSGGGGPPKPNLAATLPSRLRALDDDDGAEKLKQQLQEEQRKVKRLERDLQKVRDRMHESSMSGSTGSSSVPHVELSELQEGDILSKSGGFSVIYRGTWHGTPVAIKKLFDPSNSAENLAELDNEVEKLGKLRHPNILSLLAVHRRPPVFSIIMEVVTGGSLHQLLHSKHLFCIAPGRALPVPLHDLVGINRSVALALSFMHARNVVHRDVKAHNVLLSPHLEVKVCDFGLARMKSELMTGAMQYAGTPQYMAPELLRMQKYTEKVDVFAFGTLLWECMAEDIPFANLDTPEIRHQVFSGKMLPMPTCAPSSVQGLIKACWALEPAARPAMADVLGPLRSESA